VKKELDEIKTVLLSFTLFWLGGIRVLWWLAKNVPIEFITRKLRIFNAWPNYMKLAIVIGGFTFILIIAIHQKRELYRLIFT